MVCNHCSFSCLKDDPFFPVLDLNQEIAGIRVVERNVVGNNNICVSFDLIYNVLTDAFVPQIVYKPA